MRTFLVGGGGRESALGLRLGESSELSVLAPHENPSLKRLAEDTGGTLTVGDICDPEVAARSAKAAHADLAVVSSDAPIAAGVVDALISAGIPTMGATQKAAEIEWNKGFSRQVVDIVEPSANPRYHHVKTPEEIRSAIADLCDVPVVVKPQGLTGGKGVKVMGYHLDTYDDAVRYAESLVAKNDFPIIEERIDGIEFTIQAITDGIATFFPPATYDYPYRYDGDTGPGTGGMGSFSCNSAILPFIEQDEYETACSIMQKVIDYLGSTGRKFSGVLNGGFFVSRKGLTVIEFNARFGDPECMNIMSLMESNWVETVQSIAAREFRPATVRLRDEASVVVYLVAPTYPNPSAKPTRFNVDLAAAERMQTRVYFSSTVPVPGGYEGVGASRAVAFAATNKDLSVARNMAYAAIEEAVEGPLEFRRDIAGTQYLDKLIARRQEWLLLYLTHLREYAAPRIGPRLLVLLSKQAHLPDPPDTSMKYHMKIRGLTDPSQTFRSFCEREHPGLDVDGV